MPDREKVINGLREMSYRATWKDIDRIRHKFQPIINDALSLLKEQDNCENCAIAIEDRQSVVRCKDCTFRNEINCPLYYRRSELTDNWFCADGEREET